MRKAYLLAAVPLFVVASRGQQAIPPPPRPADSGPSLEATMQYLQQKLNSRGTVSYVVPWHDINTGNDGSNTFIDEITNVSADVAGCQINFHNKVTRDGTVISDGNFAVQLKIARDLVVEPIEQFIGESNARAGKPNLVEGAATPPVLAIVVRRQTAGLNEFDYTDPDMADRVAKAFTHAIELCGGGNKELF